MSQGLGFTVTAWFFLSFRLGGYEQLPDLRHTFATMALSSGVDVKTLSSMLGHYSAGFTLDTYTHITNDMQRGAAEKIGGFMETATAKPELEPPDPPEENRCKVIPFGRVG